MKRRFTGVSFYQLFFTAGVLTAALLFVFILVSRSFRQKQREELKNILFLSYKLHEIELCSFQVVANRSLNAVLRDYADSVETYQVSKWNKDFSAYIESFIEENFLVRDAVFIPATDDVKKALTVREDLTFNEIHLVRNSAAQEQAVKLNGKLLWYNTGTHLLALRLIKAYKTQKPLGIICFYVNTHALNSFTETLTHTEVLLTDGKSVLYPLTLHTGSIEKPLPETGSISFTGGKIYIIRSQPVSKNNPLEVVSYTNSLTAALFFTPYLKIFFGIISCSFLLFSFYLKRQTPSAENSSVSRFLARNNIQLSEREFAVLTLICEGLTNKEIAFTLALEEQTVKNYTSSLYKKIGVTSRVAACKAVNSIFILVF